MKTTEQKHRDKALEIVKLKMKNTDLQTIALKLPQEIRAFGVVNILMKYNDKEVIAEALEQRIWAFLTDFGIEKPPTETPKTTYFLNKIQVLQGLDIRVDMLLQESMIGFAEELRKVVKILSKD
jgi:hypothetical protein